MTIARCGVTGGSAWRTYVRATVENWRRACAERLNASSGAWSSCSNRSRQPRPSGTQPSRHQRRRTPMRPWWRNLPGSAGSARSWRPCWCARALYRPFANRKEVAAYAGLTPSPYASGDRHRDQGISKVGNPLLRKAMVELAWLWLRYQPDSALARWFTERVGSVRGRIRKIMAVALARKLLVALWRYLTTGLLPEGARLKVV